METKTQVQQWFIKDRESAHLFEKDWREIGPNIVTAASYDRAQYGETETVCGVRITAENAHLIAAAPDLKAALLEALELMEADHDSGDGCADCKAAWAVETCNLRAVLDQGYAAISKAGGRS